MCGIVLTHCKPLLLNETVLNHPIVNSYFRYISLYSSRGLYKILDSTRVVKSSIRAALAASNAINLRRSAVTVQALRGGQMMCYAVHGKAIVANLALATSRPTAKL